MLLKIIFWALATHCFNIGTNLGPKPPQAHDLQVEQITIKTCALPAPESGSGSHTGTNLSVDWSDVSGAASYHIVIRRLDTMNVVVTDDTTTSYYSTTGQSGVSYRAYVSAICSGGEASENIIVIDLLGAEP